MEKEKTYQDWFFETLYSLIDRIEREMPEYGDFAPIYEQFPNCFPNMPIDRFRIEAMKMPKCTVEDPKQRYVKVTAYDNSNSKIYTLIAGGYKADILKRLREEDFIYELDRTYKRLAWELSNPD